MPRSTARRSRISSSASTTIIGQPIEVFEQRHLDDCNAGKSLQIGLDSAEDHGMSDRFEHLELSRVVENNPGQRLAVYLAFEDDVRPSLGDRGQSFTGKNEVTHGVRVDGVNAPHRQ